MTVLLAGATGATGRLLAAELLAHGHHVRALVRSPERLPDALRHHERLTPIHAPILALPDADLARHARGCEAVASCLGHNLTFKGIFGKPRRLVADATRRLCKAVQANEPAAPVRFVLMNTAGNRNRDLDEPISLAQHAVVGLLRLGVPPHSDNEQAADYLRTTFGRDHDAIEWAAVRPDTLIDADTVTPYEVHPSPTRSALFNPGTTSRINVAHFMADLITDDDVWAAWRGQMPVLYNAA